MNTCSRAELSRMLGCSRAYVTKAVSEGRVGIVGKGRVARINLDDGKTVAFLEEVRVNAIDKVKHVPAPPPPQEAGDDLQELSDNLENIDITNLGALSKVAIDRLKGIEAILAQRQKTAVTRGTLVPRDSVSKIFNRLFQIHVNQLRTLDQSITPDIDAVYNNNDPELSIKTSEIMNKEMFKILNQIKRIFTDWLTEHKAPLGELGHD